ncbi:hypothetical protein [Lewinella sp. W8]|uniref:hypothetical protein n=1 Tax=Lewinella sp. W8 TaxID=2528208 RepID=UPI0010674A72|nr:hypothetical protein [Lewinella sp. W8]MTB53868.1 hypothetical protein [Lewinella sp. W8]
MPDNLNQEWTDDAAFWDEAWSDMSARLDQTERKRALGWWRSLGLALLLLLPLFIFLQSRGQSNDTPALAPNPATETPADETIVSTAPATAPLAGEHLESAPTTPEAPSTPETPIRPPALPPATPVRSAGETPLSTPSVTTPVATATVPEAIAERAPLDAPPVAKESLDANEPEQPVPVRTVPDALPLIDAEVVESLHWEDPRELPGVIASRKTLRRNALEVEAGLNTGGIPDFGGEFAGLRYAIPLSDKLSLPVGLRYQHHNWRISGLDNDVSFEQVADPGNPDRMDAEAFLNTLSLAALDRVITNQITLRTGLEYRAGKRFTLFGGTGIHYFLSGRGPAADDNGLRLVDLAFDRGNSNQDALAFNGGSTSGEDRAPARANSFGLGVYAGAGYRIGNRWTVFSEFTLLTTPIYRGQPASVERSRLGLGIRYRIR